MTNLKTIAETLGGAVKTAAGYVCRCPCHDDKAASLSLKVNGGKVVVNCLAGCDWLTIKKELEDRGILPKMDGTKTTRPSEIIYSYKDESGAELFQKVRTAKHKGLHRRWSEADQKFIWNIQGVRNVLYNLQATIQSGLVFLCEGEKDADRLNAAGLVATTNNCGAMTWHDSFTATLKDKVVIICQDNDGAGEKRTKNLLNKLTGVAKEVRIFIPPDVPEHGDVSDWINSGGDAKEILALSKPIDELGGDSKKKKAATRDDYFQAFLDFYGPLKRDIFSDDLCYLDVPSGLWLPAANKLKAVRSFVKDRSAGSKQSFKASDIEDHLYFMEHQSEPIFMVDVPPWDGEDRIKLLADRVKLKDQGEGSGINAKCFEESLKFWHSKMWLRLNSSEVRNEIFILAGPQNIGKDFWIRENCDALGQYLVNFSIHTNERDTKEQLHRGLVMNISEFDRTSRTEVSLLKEVVTTTRTDLRFAYDRRAASRVCRCSFIASTNVRDIFNDPTGHSRYVFFEIVDIERGARFDDNDKLQVLAQGKALAAAKYQPDTLTTAAMYDFITSLTPDDEYEIMIERWDELASKQIETFGILERQMFEQIRGYSEQFYGFLPNKNTYEIIDNLAKTFNKSTKKVRNTLKSAGRSHLDRSHGRGFFFKRHMPDTDKQTLMY